MNTIIDYFDWKNMEFRKNQFLRFRQVG